MTKQEAIEHLTAYRDMWKVNTLTRGCTESVGWVTVEALDMAIEALSCSEEPNRSDLIRRQDAIDAITTWDKFGVDDRSRIVTWHEGLEPYVHLRDVVTAIVGLPSAQPEHPLLKIIQDFKEMTGCEDVLVVQKDAMKAWDENGVAYTMQPERKKGEWIEDGYDHYKAVCDQCGEPCATYVMNAPRDRFCKWCGADMRGE